MFTTLFSSRAGSLAGNCAGLFLVLVPIFLPASARAQGTSGDLVILQTAAGVVLVTEEASVAWGVADPVPLLNFKFGFSTDESPSPGEFLDSLSVTLQTDNQDLTILLLTLDAFGLVVAPSTPGTTPLDPEEVVTTPIDFPSLQPVLANQFAFEFTARLPPQLAGRNASLYFDLFNNLNPLQSLGWFSPEIRVPEPSAAAFGVLGLAAMLLRRRWSK
jgi:hypothetical protein